MGRVDEQARRRFERARLAGDRSPLADFLPAPGHEQYLGTLEELVLIEAELQSKDPEAELTPLETWIERFPELGAEEVRGRLGAEWATILTGAELERRLRRAGRYELREEIGSGSFARVFRAWDPELEREVAVKLLRSQYLGEPRTVRRFQLEARSAANLHHPNILPVHEVGSEAGVPFIVSELVQGPTLEERLREARPDPRQAARWVAELCEALEYAHRCGVVHRDVKPANVLTTAEGELRLGDFGLALMLEGESGLTREGDLLGTPAYMSPEQVRGDESIDERTDVYSLGVLLYRALCGQVPFEGSWSSVLHRVVDETPVAPGRRVAGVPTDLETICLQAMAKSADERYASAAALGADLRAFLNHEPIRARRPSILESLALWCRRNPDQAMTIAVAAVIVLVVAGLGLRGVLKERDRFRRERDVAQANLYRAFVGEARGKLEARGAGWWWEGMDRLRRARALETEAVDVPELRELAIEFLGTSGACFRALEVFGRGESAVRDLALDAATTRFAVGRADGAVELRALPANELLFEVELASEVVGLEFHPRGHLLAVAGGDGILRFLDCAPAAGGAVAFEIAFGQAITALAASRADGTLAVALEDGAIVLSSGWREAAQLEYLRAGTSPARDLRFSPDGRSLASAHENEDMLAWDVDLRRVVDSMSTGDEITAIDVDDGGQVYASVFPWYSFVRFREGQRARPSVMHSRPATALRLGGRWIFSASEDGEIRAWTPNLVEAAASHEVDSPVSVLDSDAEGNLVLSGHEDGGVCLLELRQPLERHYVHRGHDVDFLDEQRLFLVDRVEAFDEDFGRSSHRVDPLSISCLVVTGSGGEFLCGGEDGRLRAVSGDGEVLAQWPAHEQGVSALAVDADGARAISISSSGQVKLWDLRGRFELTRIELGEVGLRRAEWDLHGDRVLLSGDGQPRLLEISGVRLSQTTLEPEGPATFVGGDLAVGTDHGVVVLLDSRTGDRLRELETSPEPVEYLLWNAHRAELLVAHADGRVQALAVADGAHKRAWISPFPEPSWLALDPSSSLLLVGGANTRAQTVFDYRTARPMARFLYGGRAAAQFTPDSGELLFPAATGGVTAVSLAELLEFDAEQSRISSERTSSAPRFDRLHTRLAGGHNSVVWGSAASADGRSVATVSHAGVVKLWRGADELELVWSRDGHETAAWSVAFDPAEERIASTALEVKLWSVATGEELMRLAQHEKLISSAVFLRGAPWLVTGSLDGSVRVWDLESGELVAEPCGGEAAIHSLALDPGGRWLAAAAHDQRILLWDGLERGDPGRAPDRVLATRPGAPWGLGFDRQGGLLAVACERGRISLWDVDDWRCLTRLHCDSDLLRSASFSADGRLLAAGSFAGAAIVWNLDRVRDVLRDLDLDW